MPLPRPQSGETEKDFVARGMSLLKDEYPREDQRLAVLYGIFRRREQYEMAGDPVAPQFPLPFDRVSSIPANPPGPRRGE